MCGVIGFYSERISSRDSLVDEMLESIGHRGPDGSGQWNYKNLVFGHNRLSIIDLSSEGDQPMTSADGRYCLSYNGEIYNFQDIRKQLVSFHYPFQGKSDSEVLLAAFQIWGLEKTLDRINGMYAFALWDQEKQTLSLVRDRMGEKPLYYGFNNGDFVFASELKPIRRFCRNLDINRDALCLFFRHNYIPSPHSIYQNIYKLRPGHFIQFTLDQIKNGECPPSKAYWRLDEHIKKPLPMDETEASCQLENRIRDSVQRQMVSDVPIGAFLSGGIDSSLVSAMMQSLSQQPIHTFSIGFDVDDLNEAPFAKEVARHIGSDHYEMYVDGPMCLDVVEHIPEIYDEPFADSSQIPTFLVSKLAKEKVTVCLSGDGGDELFGGYNRYFLTDQYWHRIQNLPFWLRRSLGCLAKNTPPAFANVFYRGIKPVLPMSLRFESPADKMKKAAKALETDQWMVFYKKMISHHENPDEFVIGGKEPKTPLDHFQKPGLNPIETMMAMDALTYLPGDILTKVDRASMALSLETRVPLLDREVVEFAWSLPFEYKVKAGIGKNILRQILNRYVPRSLVERTKKGFGVPLAQWIQKDLKDLTCDLLSPQRLDQQGFINSHETQKMLREHLSGKRNWQYILWDIIVFQLWLQKQK